MPSCDADRQRLEQLYRQSPSLSIWQRFGQFFSAIGVALWQVLRWSKTGPKGHRNVPQIWRYFDINGAAIWYVYDPITRQRLIYRSEADMLAWLETWSPEPDHTTRA